MISTSIMKDVFPTNKNPYTLRNNSQFSRRLLKTVYSIWDLVTIRLIEIDSLEFSSSRLKNRNLKTVLADYVKSMSKMLFFYKIYYDYAVCYSIIDILLK